MRAIFAIFTFFLFSIGNLLPGYSSDIDLSDDIFKSEDQFLRTHLQKEDHLVFTEGDSNGKGNQHSTESRLVEPSEEELSSSETTGKTSRDNAPGNPGIHFSLACEKHTTTLKTCVRQSTDITPNTPIYILYEVFRI